MSEIAELDFLTSMAAVSTADYDVPEDALRWLGKNWSICAPLLIDSLRQFVSGKDRTEANAHSLTFTTLLMAERREPKAFEPLCDLAMVSDQLIDQTMGDDWVTSTLPSLFVSTYDGNASRLKRLIESPKTDQFARSSALEAFTCLTALGSIEMAEARAYFSDLSRTLKPRSENFIWTMWATANGQLGFVENVDAVKAAFDQGFISPYDMSYRDFEIDLEVAKTKGAQEYLKTSHVAVIEDAVAVLSGWYHFSDQRKIDEKRAAAHRLLSAKNIDVPVPIRDQKVGRNEPCLLSLIHI